MNIVTPVGRIVQGSAFRGSTTDFYDQPLLWKSGANKGQPRVEWYIGLAIAKDAPGIDELWASITAVAADARPQGVPQNYAYKFLDGDGVDSNGQPYSDREGHAGHFIFRFTTSYAPKCYKDNGSGQMQEIPAEEVKTGFFVQIAGSIEDNGDTGKPGLYMNLNMVNLVAFGAEINSGPDANQVFGGQVAAALPAGATAAPAAPANQFAAIANGVPGAPAAAPQAAPAAAPQPIAPAPAPAPAAPNQGFTQVPPAA